MRGVGGPLLCIGDLLSDVGEEEEQPGSSGIHHSRSTISPPTPSSPSIDLQHIQPSRLLNLFQENYDRLNEALGGTDHWWTALTLELCNSLETANKLVQLTNSHVSLLSEKVGELESIIKKGDHAIATANAIRDSPVLISQNMKQFRPDN